MTQEELNRFLQTVRRTRLVDYLSPQDGETAQAALDRRLAWAARAMHEPTSAPEASFLLQHQDALRSHLLHDLTDGFDEDWIESADAGHEDDRDHTYQTYTRPTTEAIDLDAPLEIPSTPVRTPAAAAAAVESGTEPILKPRRPRGPPPRPAAIQREPDVPAPDRTPMPVASPRAAEVNEQRAGSPLLDRARRRTPTPSISRISPRVTPARSPGSTPSPPPSAGRQTGPALPPRGASPRPTPSRWSATPAALRSPTPQASPSASYGAPAPVGTPTPRGMSPRPIDVRIKSESRFTRSNDQYGTSEVVYESELEQYGKGLRTPMPIGHVAPTPHSAEERADILGSLRGSARKGAPPPISLARREGTPGLPLYLGAAIAVILMGTGAWYFYAQDPLGVLRPEALEDAEQGAAYKAAIAIPEVPVETVGPAGAGDDTDVALVDADGAPLPDAPVATEGAPTAVSPTPKDTLRPQPVVATPKPKPAVTEPKPKPAVTEPKPEPVVATTTPEPIVEPEPKPEPKPEPQAVGGAWRGTVGNTNACLVDFTQRGEDISGTVTVSGKQYRVSGRFNSSMGSVYLKGVQDSGVLFKGEVNGDRVNGTAKLGAGQITQAWQLRR